ARLRHALGRTGHAGQGFVVSVAPARNSADRAAPVRLRTVLDLEVAARLQAGDLPGEPRAAAAPGFLQCRAAAPAQRRPAPGVRAQRGLPDAAALRPRPAVGAARTAGDP